MSTKTYIHTVHSTRENGSESEKGKRESFVSQCIDVIVDVVAIMI